MDRVLRSALLFAYNYTCFYCQQPLDWNELEIDHILPQSLSNDEFRSICQEIGFSELFSCDDPINLVPVHKRCNKRKTDNIFHLNSLHYYFNITKSKQRKISQEIKKLNERRQNGQILHRLSLSLKNGQIKESELLDYIYDYKAEIWRKKEINIPRGIQFRDQIYNCFYLDQDFDQFFDKIVISEEGDQGLTLTNGDQDIEVYTLREWITAISNGFSAIYTPSVQMEGYFIFLNSFITALKKAELPRISFVSDPWVSLSNLALLSPSVLNQKDDSASKYLKENLSIIDLVERGIVKEKTSTIYDVCLEFEWFELAFREQFRADFNNDGIEDIYIHGRISAINGTFSTGFTDILTRYSPKHLIEKAK